MVWEGTRGKNMRPNRLNHNILKSTCTCSMNTVLFVNATIAFSEIAGEHEQSNIFQFRTH